MKKTAARVKSALRALSTPRKRNQQLELTENAAKIIEAVKAYEKIDIRSYIEKNIAAGEGTLSQDELVERILGAPADLDWFYEENYYYYACNKDMYRDHTRRFRGFKKYLGELLAAKEAAAKVLNALAG